MTLQAPRGTSAEGSASGVKLRSPEPQARGPHWS
jgi:hypothetical protein